VAVAGGAVAVKLTRALLIGKRSPQALLRAASKVDRGREGESSADDLRLAYAQHRSSLRSVRSALDDRGIEVVDHALGRPMPKGRFDLIVCVGGDGTLLEASHIVRDKTPVLGVNSAPTFSVGFLTGCRAPTFGDMIDGLRAGKTAPLMVHRMAVLIGRRPIAEPVLNDVLFCHESPAQTSRYRLITPQAEESQRSSGIWVSTAAGSTAALRSAGGEALPLDDDRLAFAVREPYAPPGSTVHLTRGTIARDTALRVVCELSEAHLYIDGAHKTYSVKFGQVVTFKRHARPLHLVRMV
jgi:NAD+ kinase